MSGPPATIEALIELMARLPGLGPRSARRAVLYLVRRRGQSLVPLAEAMARVAETARDCVTCGNLATADEEISVSTAPGQWPDLRGRGCGGPLGDGTHPCLRRALSRPWRHAVGAGCGGARGSGPAAAGRPIAREGIAEVILALNATLKARPTPTSPTCCRAASRSAPWPRACRWGSSSTISTTAPSARRSGRASRSERRGTPWLPDHPGPHPEAGAARLQRRARLRVPARAPRRWSMAPSQHRRWTCSGDLSRAGRRWRRIGPDRDRDQRPDPGRALSRLEALGCAIAPPAFRSTSAG